MTRPLTIAACLAVATATLWATATAQEATQTQTPAAPAAAASASTATATITGDGKRGRELAYTCQGCHGVTGYKNAYPSYHVPKIGGQSEAYLNAALLEYRKGARKHPTMQAQAQSFSEQDIADIAAFLASVK